MVYKEVVTHPAGSWNQWSDEYRKELEQGSENTTVGDKVVFENDEFRIWSIHLPPGKRLGFHKHFRPYFWTILTEGSSLSHHNDGSIWETDYHQGDTKYFSDLSDKNFFIHDLKNTGKTTLVFTTVEFLNK